MGIGIELNVILAYAFGLVLLYFLGWLFIISTKLLIRLIINSVIGGICLIVFNLVAGAFFQFSIGVNPISALIVGFLGIPGVLLLILLKFIL